MIKIIYSKMTMKESIISDVLSIAILLAGVWFNNEFIGGSKFVNAVIVILLIMQFISNYFKWTHQETEFKVNE